MASNYKRHFKHKDGSFLDMMSHYIEIKKEYSNVSYKINRDNMEIYIKLQPTEDSYDYMVKIVTQQGSTNVDIFVVKPNLKKIAGENKIPHLYSNGSLCLYYPKYHEWSYQDSWAETLVPWTCLWLYYFELWLATGEWLGGGIHLGDEKKRLK